MEAAWLLPSRLAKMRRTFLSCAVILFWRLSASCLVAAEPPGPVIDELVVSGPQKSLRVTPAPGAQAYQFFSASNLTSGFVLNTNFVLTPYVTGYTTNLTTNGAVTITNLAYEWRHTNFPGASGFFTMSASLLPSNTVTLATVLNRLAYGPTPDDLVTYSNNPQAFINEQLNMDGIPETLDAYTIEVTNAIPSNPLTNWTQITQTGTLASANFYLFTTKPGDLIVDDFELNPHIYTNYLVTNIVNSVPVVVTNSAFSHIEMTNLLSNGDFETGSLSPWTTTNSTAGSVVEIGAGRFGGNALHLVSTLGTTTPSSNFIRQLISTTGFKTTTPCSLSYWYLPSTNSNKLRVQLGNGLNSTPGGIPPPPTWVYAKATGTATATSAIYLYLSGAGTAYIDDMVLVSGANAGVGVNLLLNGDFESPLSGSWTNSADFTNSTISTEIAHSGASSLKLVARAAGGGANDSVQQNISPALVPGATYTLSYWYLPTAPNVTLTARLSGSILSSTPDTDTSGLTRRLDSNTAAVADLRAWFCQHAVNSKRQLFEILSQFLENHFVTQWSKSRDFLTGKSYSGTVADRLATDWEWREMIKWRNALLNPNCTFYDLLKISAESPAMIVYLDSVNSSGAGNAIANENYARELLELFTFGVDNGYDQNDIVQISRACSGWSTELVDVANANNPFAPASVTQYAGSNSVIKPALIGTWAFNFKSGSHGTNRAPLFPGKTVPARFGPPWAGANYELTLPARTGTNGIQDGYDVIEHLADQPFTQEYISVKLCRLFVHDEFPNPTSHEDREDYFFYDYTDPNRSAEAELVHQCMLAWENSTPKGNIRAVLNVIFNSELFRSQAANAQKVKTPLEFIASAVRALRASTNSGAGFTAGTDGYAFATPLGRMGGMLLFDRDAPDGYPETGPNWISAGTLVERIRFVQSLCILGGQTGHNGGQSGTGNDAGNNFSDPVTLLKLRLPAGSWGNAGEVTDLFLGLLYPAEGAANLQLYRDAGIKFLNTEDNGITASTFSTGLGAYDIRVRGLVAMLMSLQRFQEQ
jgi:uncharacterized protein (DUF1800 family)